MLSISPKSIIHLAKLQRAVLRVNGVRYSISEEKGLLELLKFVQTNPDASYDALYQSFVNELTPEEKMALQLTQSNQFIKSNPASRQEPSIPTPSAPTTPTAGTARYYRGVKIQGDDETGKH
jgi:hypothetical protein